MPPRAAAACNACRSKKQKCGGSTPTSRSCQQCQITNQQCTWPEQKKRGPSKGYIDGLESRLVEAERLLLRLLPLVSQEQLEEACRGLNPAATGIGDSSTTGHSSAQVQSERGAPGSAVGMRDMAEPSNHFSLSSPESIRHWQSRQGMPSMTSSSSGAVEGFFLPSARGNLPGSMHSRVQDVQGGVVPAVGPLPATAADDLVIVEDSSSSSAVPARSSQVITEEELPAVPPPTGSLFSSDFRERFVW